MQRSVRPAADVVRPAPVEELPPWPRRGDDLAGRAGSAAPTTRGRARPGSDRSVTRPSRTSRARTSRSPSTLQRSPRRSVRCPRGAKRSSPRLDRTAASPSGWSVRCIDEVDAVERERACGRSRGTRPRAGVTVEHVDLRGARARAHGDLRGAGLRLPHPARRQHAEAVERAEQVDLVLDLRLRVIRADDHGVVLEERVGAAGSVHEPLDLLVGRGERGDLRVRAVLVRVRVVVRQREQQEVEQVVLDQVLADAPGVLVAHARACRAASGSPSCATRRCRRRRTRAGRRRARLNTADAIRVSAVSVRRLVPVPARGTSGRSCPAVRTSASSSDSNTVGVSGERCSPFIR